MQTAARDVVPGARVIRVGGISMTSDRWAVLAKSVVRDPDTGENRIRLIASDGKHRVSVTLKPDERVELG